MQKPEIRTSESSNPLVSVICRSINRKELHEALASVARQSYAPIELLLVDATGKGIEVDSELKTKLNIKIVSTGQVLHRAEAANAGLDSSSGDYLMFLDDDDWISEHHLTILLDFLNSQNQIKVAYSSVQKVKIDGSQTSGVFAQDYDPVLLRRDNYIPIHSVVFSRSLLSNGCRFDTQMDIYEDWDFWLQLSRYTVFKHVNEITAFYRQGGDSSTAIDDTSLRYNPTHPIGKARGILYSKWMKEWTGQDLNQLLGKLDPTNKASELGRYIEDNRNELQALATHIEEKLQQIQAKDTELNRVTLEVTRLGNLYNNAKITLDEKEGVLAQTELHLVQHKEHLSKTAERLNQTNEQLNQTNENLNQTTKQLNQTNENLNQTTKQLDQTNEQLNQASAHAAQLGNTINSIYKSVSWRIMGPFRRAYRFLKFKLFPLITNSLKSK